MTNVKHINTSKNSVVTLEDTLSVGDVPEKMSAWVVRKERFGEPSSSFQTEVVDTPSIGDDEVLVYVMAAGVNYNNVWAALGTPVNVIAARQKRGEPEDFHIGGSDASGIVYKIGKNVSRVNVGDEVVVHCGMWNGDCEWVAKGGDAMYSPSFRIWGYESNYGSFAQFTRVQAHQCMPKPKHMTWEAAASYSLVGATAYRMLHGWGRNSLKRDDVVLIWGGAGGLGSMAIQIAKAAGAIPVAVVSGEDKFEFCESLGAKGCINRNEFDHWGMLPHWKDVHGYGKWLQGVRAFGAKLWEVLGEKRNPNIVFEHPGESTMPTSMFVCDTGGLVVICAGTTGYNATVDLRYLWMRQKRVQGSHFANDEQAYGMNQLALDGKLNPCLSRTFAYDELPLAHQLMYENKHPFGNMAILVGARETGLGAQDQSVSELGLRIPDISGRDCGHAFSLISHGPRLPADAMDGNTVAPDDGTLVTDLMSTGLITCGPDDHLEHVAGLMTVNDIQAVIVMEHGETIGVVSQTDVVLGRQGRTQAQARALLVRTIMTDRCVSCDKSLPLSDAITTMTRLRIHRLLVTEQCEGCEKPVGILSLTDIVRKLFVEQERPAA